MKMRTRYALILAPVLPVLFFGCAMAPKEASNAVRVRNNHERPYEGPVQFRTALQDGMYQQEPLADGTAGSGEGEVRGGVARMVVKLPAHSAVVLARTGPLPHAESHHSAGPLSITTGAQGFDLRWADSAAGALALGFVVIPGTSAEAHDVARTFEPLDIAWKTQPNGALKGEVVRGGYNLAITLVPYAEGWVDVHTRLTHVQDAGPAYVAMVRRVTALPGIDSAHVRFNGRVFEGATPPNVWERDFWYTRGVDWTSWKSGALSMATMSGFTPDPTIERHHDWVPGSHFYVWDRALPAGDQMYLISEISGPNPEQGKSGYMRVTPYAPIPKGDTIDLRWRLAIEQHPAPGWEDTQLQVFAGYQSTQQDSGMDVVDLGVPAVQFGTSYFPYSTFAENFDYYRTPGLDRETWWPFSPTMWTDWRAFIPRMQTDLHIIRAMGFEWVRLHHLELLQEMDRKDALAFLDFYMDQARQLGLKVLIDTEGPADWVSLIMGRYRDVVRRVEVENEILIPAIKPDAPERWTTLYRAAKNADPEAQVFFTSAGNDGAFERLRTLGVPFDRVGLHAYKHGPEWKEALASHALAAADYARSMGKFVTLGEFNWKGLTRLSPEDRRKEFAAVYDAMLRPRAIPEVFQFQFQETISVNPSIARSGVRHYETIALDRRPKPEARELMRMIREYARPDAPVRAVPVTIGDARLVHGRATVPFTVANHTSRALSLHLSTLAFGGIESRLTSAADIAVEPGATAHGKIALQLDSAARPGTYHHFLRVAYGNTAALGWGVASNPGAPVFKADAVLKGRVVYPQGLDVVTRFDWVTRPLAVVFGAKAPVLEMEMAYLVANTLQSATGRSVWLSSSADLPDSLKTGGSVIVVGTNASNPLVATPAQYSAGDRGVVRLRDGAGRTQLLLLTGHSTKAVEAAAVDFVLRYWLNAKDSGVRITGMEQGAALGDTARITNPNPP